MRPNPDGYNIDPIWILSTFGERVEYEGQHFPRILADVAAMLKCEGIMFLSVAAIFGHTKNAPNVGIRMI